MKLKNERNPLCISLDEIQKAIQAEMLYKKPKRAFNALYFCWGDQLVRRGEFKTKFCLTQWKQRGYLTVALTEDFLTYCFDADHAHMMVHYGNFTIFAPEKIEEKSTE